MTRVNGLGAYSEACMEAFELIDANEELIQRIKAAVEDVGEFTPIGNIALGDDIEVPAGVKTRGDENRVAREMFLGDKLTAHNQARITSLPTFTLPIHSGNWFRGILTEDFTDDGQQELFEIYERVPVFLRREHVADGLRLDVYDSLDGRVYPEAFQHMMAYVRHHELLVDFDDVALPSNDQLQPYKELAEAITIQLRED